MKNTEKFRLNLYLPKYLVEYFDEKANEIGVSRNVVITYALLEQMNREIDRENAKELSQFTKNMTDKNGQALKVDEVREMFDCIKMYKKL